MRELLKTRSEIKRENLHKKIIGLYEAMANVQASNFRKATAIAKKLDMNERSVARIIKAYNETKSGPNR